MRIFLLPLLLLLTVAGSPTHAEQEAPEIALAVVVNAKNPVKKISFGELRAYLKMTRQFWPTRKRCDLYLPPHTTDAYKILLNTVYKTSHKKLQRYWVRKLFSGDIPAKPVYVPSAKAAAAVVRRNIGALTVLPADQIPTGVRVLPVDGKKPGDKGYRLVGKKTPRS